MPKRLLEDESRVEVIKALLGVEAPVRSATKLLGDLLAMVGKGGKSE